MSSSRAAAAGWCGLGAAVLALLVPVLGAAGEPGYSHIGQFISELGARGAANARLVAAAGFAPIGILVLAFLALAAGTFPRLRQTALGLACLAMVGVAYLVAAVFPCDPGCPGAGSTSQSIHNVFGFFEYVGALVGLLLLVSTLRAAPPWRSLSRPSLAAALLVAIGLLAMLAPRAEGARGLSQRIAETGIFGWMAYASILLLRQR